MGKCKDGWVDGWVGSWVGLCQITKYQVNLDLMKIIQFCLQIYDLWGHPHLWVGVWVGSCQITEIQINLDLIEIIQFCLKIYDLWGHPTYECVHGEVLSNQ